MNCKNCGAPSDNKNSNCQYCGTPKEQPKPATVIRTNGGAFIGGNVVVAGDFVGGNVVITGSNNVVVRRK